jgi:hypothetical protein
MEEALACWGDGRSLLLLSESIIDWLDLGHPITQRMWERRLRGYRAMGYALLADQPTMTDT